MKAADIDLNKFGYREIIKLNTRVKKEYVKRNKEEYTKKCFKVGDIVKFVQKTKKVSWEKATFDLTKPLMTGIVTKAEIQKDGRIRQYHIDYYKGNSLESTVRGIRQVVKPTAKESRICKLIHCVK